MRTNPNNINKEEALMWVKNLYPRIKGEQEVDCSSRGKKLIFESPLFLTLDKVIPITNVPSCLPKAKIKPLWRHALEPMNHN